MTLVDEPFAYKPVLPAWQRPETRRSGSALFVVGALLLVANYAALLQQVTGPFYGAITTLVLQGGLYAIAVWLVLTGRAHVPLWFVLGAAVAMRIGPLFARPFFSTDIYRYVWDGRVQGAGINPYLYVPNHPTLAFLRDSAIWPLINRAEYAPTIYPPVAEMIFFLVTRAGATVFAMKAAFVLFEAATTWAVIRLLDAEGLPRERVLAYAWCPLAIWEFSGSGHIDAAMTAFVALAILARRHDKHLLTGFLLGLAVLTKFFPLLLVPALWRRWDWRLPVALAATIVSGYLVYISAGWHVLGFLPGYAGEEGLDDGSGFWIFDVVSDFVSDMTDFDIPVIAYLAFVGLMMAVLALWTMFRLPEPQRFTLGSLLLAATAMFALSPSYPWYFGWFVPMLCFVRPAWPLLWLVATGFLLYCTDIKEEFWTANIVYGGALALLAAVLVRHLYRRPHFWRLA